MNNYTMPLRLPATLKHRANTLAILSGTQFNEQYIRARHRAIDCFIQEDIRATAKLPSVLQAIKHEGWQIHTLRLIPKNRLWLILQWSLSTLYVAASVLDGKNTRTV